MADERKNKVEFIPIVYECTYHYPENEGGCPNCHGTGKYIDGYYMIINDKWAMMVDNIK